MFAAITICHDLLQYTIYMLSYQIKSNELREERDVQWLSGHSQTGKCLVIRGSLWELYHSGISMGVLSHSLLTRLIPPYSVG